MPAGLRAARPRVARRRLLALALLALALSACGGGEGSSTACSARVTRVLVAGLACVAFAGRVRGCRRLVRRRRARPAVPRSVRSARRAGDGHGQLGRRPRAARDLPQRRRRGHGHAVRAGRRGTVPCRALRAGGRLPARHVRRRRRGAAEGRHRGAGHRPARRPRPVRQPHLGGPGGGRRGSRPLRHRPAPRAGRAALTARGRSEPARLRRLQLGRLRGRVPRRPASARPRRTSSRTPAPTGSAPTRRRRTASPPTPPRRSAPRPPAPTSSSPAWTTCCSPARASRATRAPRAGACAWSGSPAVTATTGPRPTAGTALHRPG